MIDCYISENDTVIYLWIAHSSTYQSIQMKQAMKNSYCRQESFINSISQLVNVEWTISRIYRCGWFLLGETFHKNVPVWNSYTYKLVLNYLCMYLVNAPHMAVGKTHNLSNYCYVGSKLLRLQTFAKLVLGITTQIIAR